MIGLTLFVLVLLVVSVAGSQTHSMKVQHLSPLAVMVIVGD